MSYTQTFLIFLLKDFPEKEGKFLLQGPTELFVKTLEENKFKITNSGFYDFIVESPQA